MLSGNFENDDFFDLMFYGPGSTADAFWYGHNPDLAGARAGGTVGGSIAQKKGRTGAAPALT